MDSKTEKGQLLEALHTSVKACQRRFGGKKEIASNNTEACVSQLLTAWENVLNHGLLEAATRIGSLGSLGSLQQLGSTFSNTLSSTLTATIAQLNGRPGQSICTFWPALRQILSAEEAARFQQEPADRERCRHWLREKINESSLERFVHTFLGRADLLEQYYRPDAFVRDAEKSAALPNLAAGINSIIFALSPQASLQLDDEDDCAVEVAAAAQESGSFAAAASRPLRRPRPIVVSFDDDDAVSSTGSDFSASYHPESGYSTGCSRSPPRDAPQSSRPLSAAVSCSSGSLMSSSGPVVSSSSGSLISSSGLVVSSGGGLSECELRQAVADVSRAREREAAERRKAQDECRRLQAKLEQLQRENSLLCREIGKEERLALLTEMHADVSELNSQLQVSLQHAQRELELLRGPRPLSCEYPLYVTVVAAFKRGAGPTRHHVYQLYCHTPSYEWCAFRRYQQFLDFHEAASRSYPDIKDFYFPPKERNSLRDEIVRKRRLALQTYVRDVVNYFTKILPHFTRENVLRQHCQLLLDKEVLEPRA